MVAPRACIFRPYAPDQDFDVVLPWLQHHTTMNGFLWSVPYVTPEFAATFLAGHNGVLVMMDAASGTPIGVLCYRIRDGALTTYRVIDPAKRDLGYRLGSCGPLADLARSLGAKAITTWFIRPGTSYEAELVRLGYTPGPDVRGGDGARKYTLRLQEG